MKQIFYTPDIATFSVLPEEESGHAIRVLRLKEGDEVLLTDGKGFFYRALLSLAHPKKAEVEIQERIEQARLWPTYIHIAVAPTKNMDRMEWFVEKATEMGVDEISCIQCRYSERKEIKTARLEKIMVSAMKQSQKARLPKLNEIMPFSKFIMQPFEGKKFIAHCEMGDKKLLKNSCLPGDDALILIGPEGDFSPEEIELAFQETFIPVSLGDSRLRTETAALVACNTLHFLNQ